MVVCRNRPVLRCINQDVLPRMLHSPGSTGAKGAGRSNGSHNKFRMESPNALLQRFDTPSLRLRRGRVERTIGHATCPSSPSAAVPCPVTHETLLAELLESVGWRT